MERELYFSGYCFRLDRARMVELTVKNGMLGDVDCDYSTCENREKCAIGRQIGEVLCLPEQNDKGKNGL